MIAKTDYIKKLADRLVKQGKKMTFDQLAADLNAKGFRTTYGSAYNGGRGVAKLVDSVYHRLENSGSDTDADNVALAFTNSYGNFAYKK
ncbi:MAG: hypothetical protein QM743_08795 [Chitinophagaceae bacterium]